MTSMLYSTDMNKPNTLESVQPCSGQYSFRTDLKLNAWLAVGGVAYGITGSLLRHNPEWPVGLRVAVALLPLAPMLLYVRSCLLFVRGLDELQRRIQLESWLFAALGTVFLGVMITILKTHGVSLPMVENGLGLSGATCSVLILWMGAWFVSGRRYK